MKTRSSVVALFKSDIIPLTVLLSITMATRLLVIVNASFAYYFDSYTYMSQATNLISSGTIHFGVGMPFVVFLGAFYYIFGSTLGVVSASRLSMLLVSALLVSVIYFLGLRISGKIFGFLVALIAIFNPLFLSYSIVPHNDVFTIAMGLTALYLVTSDKKFGYLLAPFFFYIAVFTRPEFSLIMVVPILIFHILKLLGTLSIHAKTKLFSFILVYTLPLLLFYNYAQTFTRFGVIEKFAIFLTPGLLTKTLNLSFSFSTQPLLNQVVFSFATVGIILGLLSCLSQFLDFQKRGRFYSIKLKKDRKAKDAILSDRAILAFSLSLVFIIHAIVITGYGYGYTIVDGKLTISNWLNDRYLILPQMLTSYALAYPLSIILEKLYMPKLPIKDNSQEIVEPVFDLWQIHQLIAKIAEIEEVRKRRSDSEFKDFKRYVKDMKYILETLREKRKILDIGAGAGVFSIGLARLGFNVTATNLATKDGTEIDFFRKFGCEYVSADLDERGLPFSSEEFDGVLCLHVIEHLKKPLSTLMEIRRVLRPRGILILMTPNGTITTIYKSLQRGKGLHNSEHVREYTVDELVSMLTFLDFEIRNVDYSNEMVSASFLDISQRIKRLLVYGYSFFSILIPTISYEIHITAKTKGDNSEVCEDAPYS